MRKQTIVNLIPSYKEEENIGKMLMALQEVGKKSPNYKFVTLIVDDNSPDDTQKIVKEFQKTHSSVYLITGPKKGLGRAMIRGIDYAIRRLNADIIIPNEADFAFDPNHIPYMIKKIEEGFDLVVASRHVKNGKTEGWTMNRKLNHWVANKLFATWVAGVNQVSDHNGAFRAIRVKGVLDQINLMSLNINGFGFFSYLIFKITQVTNKIHEFPIIYKFRTAGESKVSFNPKYVKTYLRDVLEYIFLSLKIRVEKTKMLL